MRNSLIILTDPLIIYNLSDLGPIVRYKKTQEQVRKNEFFGFYRKKYITRYRNVYTFEYAYISNEDDLRDIFYYFKNHYDANLSDGVNSDPVMLMNLDWDYIGNKQKNKRTILIFKSLNLENNLSLL